MSKPAYKIRSGVLQVTIWRNTGEKGNWYSVIPTRSYKQGDDMWKETESLGFDDLLTMAKLLLGGTTRRGALVALVGGVVVPLLAAATAAHLVVLTVVLVAVVWAELLERSAFFTTASPPQ